MAKAKTEQPANRKENKKGLPEAAKPYMFKPGQSGNPNGRPKKKPITEIYEELLSDPIIRDQIKEAIKQRLTSGRMVGTIEMKEAAERLEGKVKQSVEVEGELALLTLSERMQRARERASGS
jgi:hypothetical protein